MPAPKLTTSALCWRLGAAGRYPTVVLHRNARRFSLAIIKAKGASPVFATLTRKEAAKLVEAIESISQCPWKDASTRASTLGNITEGKREQIL